MVAVANPVIFIPEKRPPVAGGRRLEIVSEYQPAGDQPQAIEALVASGELELS